MHLNLLHSTFISKQHISSHWSLIQLDMSKGVCCFFFLLKKKKTGKCYKQQIKVHVSHTQGQKRPKLKYVEE